MAKYADEIAKRFSQGSDDDNDMSSEPDADADDSSADAALGRRFLKAYKAGDAIAVVEAIRAICGV